MARKKCKPGGKRFVESLELPTNPVFTEAGDISEATFDLESKVIRNAILIKAGTSKNKRNYSAEVLRRDGPSVFEGANSYSGHVETFYERTDPRNLMGSIKDVKFDESTQALRGDIHYFESAMDTISKAQAAYAGGSKDLIGLSIQTPGKQEVVRQSGKLFYDVQSLLRDPTTSVDMVVGPAAGGRMFEAEQSEDIMNLEELKKMILESFAGAGEDFVKKITEAVTAEEVISISAAQRKEDNKPEAPAPVVPPTPVKESSLKESDVEKMIEAKIAKIEAQYKLKELVSEANLPKKMADKIVEKFQDDSGDITAVEAEIKFFKELAAKIVAPVTNNEKVTVGAESEDKLQAAMDGMFGVVNEAVKDVKPFRGIKEAYVTMTGDVDVTGHSKVRLTEAFNTANFAFILGTSMYRKMIQDYKEADWEWQKFCSIGSAPDFKTQERIRVGYLNDLPAPFDPEALDYLETDYYADEEATFDIKTTGRLLTVTRKTIINDDLNTLSKVTGRLGRAAGRTLANRIYVTRLANNSAYTVEAGNFFINNRTCTVNSNLGTNALTITGVQTTITAMEAFAEPTTAAATTGNPIGLVARPRSMILIVPPGLRWTASYINNKELIDGTEAHHNPLRGFFGPNDEDIVVSPLLTDDTDWYLAWKPTNIDWIEVDFLQGRQEPELFLQDNPTVGDVFIKDKITYKLRHEYEVVFLDCRGCYKNVVAGG